jgi:hypothetical protein
VPELTAELGALGGNQRLNRRVERRQGEQQRRQGENAHDGILAQRISEP